MANILAKVSYTKLLRKYLIISDGYKAYYSSVRNRFIGESTMVIVIVRLANI